MSLRSAGRWFGVAAAGVAIVLTTGCGPAPWNGDGGGEPTASKTSAPAPKPVENDLSGGSTQRTVTAGAVTATIDYWSTLSMDRWTPMALKPVSLSMSTTVTPDDGQKVYLQKASMVAVPANETETFEPLAPQVDQSTGGNGYLVLAPYSYSQSFNVGDVPEEATFVTLQFTYEFLVQTTPTSNEFAKQTGTDTLVVAIAPAPADEAD